jgi:uncharacterized protein
MAMVQWQAAKEGSQYLKCMIALTAPSNYVHGLVAPGGAFQLSFLIPVLNGTVSGRTVQNTDHLDFKNIYEHLPLITLDEAFGIVETNSFIKNWVTTPLDSNYWTNLTMDDKYSKVAAPTFIASGWYDGNAAAAFIQFNGMRKQGKAVKSRESIVIIGPWWHALSGESTKTGDIDFGEQSRLDLEDLELQWLDYQLNDVENDISEFPPVKIFVMGINQWRDEQEWPLERTSWQKWYLSSHGHANTSSGDGRLSQSLSDQNNVDEFDYDPSDPVPTLGGANLDNFYALAGPYNHNEIETRNDVLCYTTEIFFENMEVTGPIKVVLYASTDSLDTDWTAKIVDVSPDGYAKNLCDGILRARYRDGLGEQRLLEPNKIYKYEIDAYVTSNVFLKGHQLRIEISSSNFPRFDRNLNTGHPIGIDADMRIAHQKIYHSKEYPSHVLLPIIPG